VILYLEYFTEFEKNIKCWPCQTTRNDAFSKHKNEVSYGFVFIMSTYFPGRPQCKFLPRDRLSCLSLLLLSFKSLLDWFRNTALKHAPNSPAHIYGICGRRKEGRKEGRKRLSLSVSTYQKQATRKSQVHIILWECWCLFVTKCIETSHATKRTSTRV
jgi:hypothetical protein